MTSAHAATDRSISEEEMDEEDVDDEDNRPLIEAAAVGRSSGGLSTKVKPRHKCASCSKIFTTNSLMLQHYSAVHEKKRFPCGYCRETFAYRSGRTRHIHSVHQKLRFRCTFCKLTYTSRETAQMHVKSKHKVKDNVDLYLDKLSGGANDDTVAASRPSRLRDGGDASSLKSQIIGNIVRMDQLRKFDNSPPVVDNSDVKSKLDTVIRQMQQQPASTHRNGYSLTTSQNHDELVEQASASSLNNNNNGSAKERLKCHHCDKTFAYNAGRSKHIRIVHMNVRYRCMLCHSSYTTRDYAVQHVGSAHCIDSKHPVDYVERVQDDAAAPQHSASSTNKSLDYYNSLIDQDFEDDLSQDATEDYEEPGEDSPEAYYNGGTAAERYSSLTDGGACAGAQRTPPVGAHVNNNLPFHCLQCGVGYETQESLIYHANLEHEEQKISCDYCGKALLRAASLVGHMRQAHANISYRCAVCGALFLCPADGAYHIEDTHQSDPSEHLEHVPAAV